MTTFLPFIYIGIGFILGMGIKNRAFLRASDRLAGSSLLILMFSIGLGIAMDEMLISQMGYIGLNCLVICLMAMGCSVLITYIFEMTLVPLDKIDEKIKSTGLGNVPAERDGGSGNFDLMLMPLFIGGGLTLGSIYRENLTSESTNLLFTACLLVLYISVGISLGANREVFDFIQILRWRVILLSVSILLGSVLGGIISGIILKLPVKMTSLAAGGMGYYSVTGAYMTKAHGVEMGAYGFIVNVMLDFLTVLFLPLLRKISMGSPIASAASGNMDTMLAPVTKFVGLQLGLVALVTGTILTILVPILLPILDLII